MILPYVNIFRDVKVNRFVVGELFNKTGKNKSRNTYRPEYWKTQPLLFKAFPRLKNIIYASKTKMKKIITTKTTRRSTNSKITKKTTATAGSSPYKHMSRVQNIRTLFNSRPHDSDEPNHHYAFEVVLRPLTNSHTKFFVAPNTSTNNIRQIKDIYTQYINNYNN